MPTFDVRREIKSKKVALSQFDARSVRDNAPTMHSTNHFNVLESRLQCLANSKKIDLSEPLIFHTCCVNNEGNDWNVMVGDPQALVLWSTENVICNWKFDVVFMLFGGLRVLLTVTHRNGISNVFYSEFYQILFFFVSAPAFVPYIFWYSDIIIFQLQQQQYAFSTVLLVEHDRTFCVNTAHCFDSNGQEKIYNENVPKHSGVFSEPMDSQQEGNGSGCTTSSVISTAIIILLYESSLPNRPAAARIRPLLRTRTRRCFSNQSAAL